MRSAANNFALERIKSSDYPAPDLRIFFHREEQIQTQTDVIVLPVGMLPGIVFMLVIEIEFNVFADREQRTGVQIRGTPILVQALIEGLGRNVRNQVVGTNRNRWFHRQFIPITPSENSVFPVEIRTVSSGSFSACCAYLLLAFRFLHRTSSFFRKSTPI
jgi:hypothetical protein